MHNIYLYTVVLIFVFGAVENVSVLDLPGTTPSYNYTLRTTWDNKPTSDNAEIFLSFTVVRDPYNNYRSLRINIDAPFYNDPTSPENSTLEPFPGLWEYEVVEAFFLGENDEYLEIELAPSAHYLLLYLKGYRNDTNSYLPVYNFTTGIYNSSDDTKQRWTGEAFIPAEYFPCNVTKFNAYAIHYSDFDRVYMSLFPITEGELQEPDFHYLPAFKTVPFPSDLEISPLCQKHSYTLDKTWDNKNTSDYAEIFLSFQVIEDNSAKSLLIEVNAPFYNDPKSPDTPNDQPFPGLWEYEVVELFFLGAGDEYLEIELAPSGHYLLLYLNGYRNDTGRVLPLTYHVAKVVNTTNPSEQQRWIGEAIIPGEYFPCNVTKFNAYAIHNTDPDRVYMSLFPVSEGELEDPDFHCLDGFGSVEFQNEVNSECDTISTSTSTSTDVPTSTSDRDGNNSGASTHASLLLLIIALSGALLLSL